MCTLLTSGQVASTKTILRAIAAAGTDFGTPWAEKITGLSDGHSSSVSTKIAPFERNSSTTYLLCTISCLTKTGAPHFSRAISTILMARSTPAQNPRGAARYRSKFGFSIKIILN